MSLQRMIFCGSKTHFSKIQMQHPSREVLSCSRHLDFESWGRFRGSSAFPHDLVLMSCLAMQTCMLDITSCCSGHQLCQAGVHHGATLRHFDKFETFRVAPSSKCLLLANWLDRRRMPTDDLQNCSASGSHAPMTISCQSETVCLLPCAYLGWGHDDNRIYSPPTSSCWRVVRRIKRYIALCSQHGLACHLLSRWGIA